MDRLCIGCQKSYNVEKLIKLKFSDNKIYINPDYYLSGRSAYLCYNMNCIKIAKKQRKLEKSFRNKIKINDETWQSIDSILETEKDNLSLT